MSRAVVYRVGWDATRFQYLLYDLAHPGFDLFQFNGTSRLDSWTPQPVYVYEPRLEPPDIWHIVTAAVLVMSQSVVEALEPFISQAGELLPLRMVGSDDELYALNILRDFDCIDWTEADLDDLKLYPNFIPHRLPESGLLKVPPLDTAHIFYLERDEDGDSLRARIDQRELKGLTFEPVWSEVGGPVPINLMLE
jgi:hypothetical protein